MNVRAAGKRRLDMQFFLPNYWPHSSAVDTRSTCTETLIYFSGMGMVLKRSVEMC